MGELFRKKQLKFHLEIDFSAGKGSGLRNRSRALPYSPTQPFATVLERSTAGAAGLQGAGTAATAAAKATCCGRLVKRGCKNAAYALK